MSSEHFSMVTHLRINQIKAHSYWGAIGAASCGFGLYRALVSGYHAGDGLE
jgi:hypothetical protein